MRDLVLAVFSVSWLLYLAIIIGNNYGIYIYDEPSGIMVSVIAQLAPVIAVYMLMTVWNDISSVRDYFDKICAEESRQKTVITVCVFTVLHIIIVSVAGEANGRSLAFLPAAIGIVFLNYGLAEIAWRGMIFPAFWEHMPFFVSCMLTGVLHTIYFLPVFWINKETGSVSEFVLFLFLCIFQALILGCIYCITRSVVACIISETVIQVMMYFFDGLTLNNPRATVLYMVEIAIVIATMYIFTVKLPGRGWVDAEKDDFK